MLWISRIAILVAILFVFVLWASGEEIDLSIIAQVESSNNPMAISFKGAKYGRGLMQISEIALLDYNIENNAAVAPEELFIPEVVQMVARWMFEVRLPQLLRNIGISATVDNLLFAYSAGVGNVKRGIMPEETRKYIEKYHSLMK